MGLETVGQTRSRRRDIVRGGKAQITHQVGACATQQLPGFADQLSAKARSCPSIEPSLDGQIILLTGARS